MTEYEIITEVMRREGWDTFTNHPADRGGPTKWGITLASWSAYIGTPATPADIQAITELGARTYYRHVHIIAPKFDQVNDPHLRELLIDAGVNHGPRHPTKWVQWAAEVAQDGILGPLSLKAINEAAPLELFMWVLAFRTRLYGRLVSRDPSLKEAKRIGLRLQAEFAEGWNNRAAAFLEEAARRVEIDHNQRGIT